MNYTLEFNIKRWHEIIITSILISEAMGTITITIWYQFIDRGWFLLQLICLILGVLCLIYLIFVVPESPKWLYIKERFEEARNNLVYVAHFNFLSDSSIRRLKKL